MHEHLYATYTDAEAVETVNSHLSDSQHPPRTHQGVTQSSYRPASDVRERIQREVDIALCKTSCQC